MAGRCVAKCTFWLLPAAVCPETGPRRGRNAGWPSPTLAAGWVTSISRRMACPSLVSTMPANINATQQRTGRAHRIMSGQEQVGRLHTPTAPATAARAAYAADGWRDKAAVGHHVHGPCSAGWKIVADRCWHSRLSPPLGSSSIFSMDRGPSVVRIMSETACVSEKRDVRLQEACTGPLRANGRANLRCRYVAHLGLLALLPFSACIEHCHGYLHGAVRCRTRTALAEVCDHGCHGSSFTAQVCVYE